MCSPTEKGGLGIKKLEIFNKSLLGKWMWRFWSENDSLWRDVFLKKYNIKCEDSLVGGCYGKKGSQWWCDLTGYCEFVRMGYGGFQIILVEWWVRGVRRVFGVRDGLVWSVLGLRLTVCF